MIAVLAFLFLLLYALGITADAINFAWLGIALLALHFAWDFHPWHGSRGGSS